jgi:hypothetical protein
LNEELSALGERNKKILVLARGQLTAEAAAWYAQGLQGRPEKSALALWGFSLTTAHRQPLAAMTRSQVLGLYRNWRAENGISRFDYRFPHPSWDSFVGSPAGASVPDAVPGTTIPDAVARDPQALDAFLDSASSSYVIGLDTADCDMAEASRDADAARALVPSADGARRPPRSAFLRDGEPGRHAEVQGRPARDGRDRRLDELRPDERGLSLSRGGRNVEVRPHPRQRRGRAQDQPPAREAGGRRA